MTVRVDVDRFFPQHRISVELFRLFPRATAHVIAEVTSDQCLGLNNRRVEADVTYRDGTAALFPWTKLVFEARRAGGIGYGGWRLTVSGGGVAARSYDLVFVSQYFDPVEFEVDCVANAGQPVTAHATHSHPNRPATLPSETLSLATVYQRSGFDAKMSPNANIIPTSGTGANGTWSDAEMHNAMVTFWSRFANRPNWAMWVLYAARHDMGRGLGGIMFDDIGPNHRQGTAIFRDSFIQDAPAGDTAPAAWRNRMEFWTATHEMGHAFNLAHSWQKALGTPWLPLANEPEARSFMNYPFNVAGGQTNFFSDFAFRFSDNELVFMRHAPRRFVQMGNSDWFVNHGFEAPSALELPSDWALEIRPNRELNGFAFMEPVKLELKLTNMGDSRAAIERDLLTDGKHVSIVVGRKGGASRLWRSFMTKCEKEDAADMKPGESLYGSHLVGASTNGWLIDEPGFYKVQAAVDVGGRVIVSNVLRLYVAPPRSEAETALAPDYFTEDVARVIAFGGAPELDKANDVLRAVEDRLGQAPAGRQAAVALSSPLLGDFKSLKFGDGDAMRIEGSAAKVGAAAKLQQKALLEAPDQAAQAFGHIDYFGALDRLFAALKEAGDDKGATSVLEGSVKLMKKRGIVESVVAAAERKLKRQG